MVNDKFGIKLLYPSSTTNEQSLFFPDRSSELQSSGNLQSKVTNLQGTMSTFVSGDIIGWYEFEPENGDDVKMLFLPSSLTSEDNEITIDVNCDLNHEEAASQGYVNNSGEWQNIEMTSHIFVKTVNKPTGYIIMEARNGYDSDKKGGCCQGTAYGVRLFWDTSATKKGKFEFYKKVFTGAEEESQLFTQDLPVVIPSFYQEWFGAKFCVYNVPVTGGGQSDRVRLELWLTPVIFANPGHALSNLWKKVGIEEDYAGKGWNDAGGECDALEDDSPITWATPFVGFGWKDGTVIQFNYTSCREIDVAGTFGEDPEPPPNPNPGPGLPDPDPIPPTTPDPQPPDAEPPLTPTTMTKRLTIRREVINNKLCSCDGIQSEDPTTPPGGGTGGGGTGGGGGGGTGTLLTLYNVALNTASFARLAKVTGSTTLYLRFGQGVTQTNSVWIGKSINRVEITIADQGNPTGGTGGGVSCVIRKGSDDTIAATLSPIATETEILNAGKVFIFENLTNTYKLVFGDMLLFEYDGGDTNNYVKIFQTEQPVTTGTKIVWRANNQDAGEYSDAPALDICARVYTLTP
jgi:hypothetical protein